MTPMARTRLPYSSGGAPWRRQLPQNILKDATVTEVFALFRRVDAHAGGELNRFADSRRCPHIHLFRVAAAEPADSEHFMSRETERLRVLSRQELQWHYTHADEIGAMNALVAFRDHGFHAEQHGALRCPVAGGAGPVLASREDDERCAFLLVTHGRVV